MVNYATDLQYLYQSGDVKKPYYIDNLLFQFISESGFENVVNVSGYLNDPASINIFKENAIDVKNYIGIVTPGDTTPATQYPAPVRSNNFTGNASADEVFITLTPATQLSGTVYRDMVKDITTSPSAQSDAVVKDHNKFRQFLFETIEDVVKYNFYVTKSVLASNISSLPDNDPRKIMYDPIVSLQTMKITNLGYLISNIKDVCVRSFKDILAQSPTVTSNIITDFKTGNFTSPVYYNLRSLMIQKLDISRIYVNIDENMVLYFKKVVVDMFLKTCYPLVHMLFMQSIMEWYAASGDYVNVRIIVLSMTYYVFFTLKAVYNLNTSITPNSNQLTSQNMTDLNNLFSKLNIYLANNNKIDVNSDNSTNDEMKKLIIGLHDLSSTVTSTNKDIQSLKNSIRENQLTMRNVLFNLDVKRKEYNAARRGYYIALTILIIFVVVNTILLVLKKPEYVFYTSGFFGIAAVLYLITIIIMSFLK